MKRLGAWRVPSPIPRVKRAGGLRSDSGITTLQVLIMFPVMMLLITFSMQVALNFYAREAALAAAQEGANAIRMSETQDDTTARIVAEQAIAAFLPQHANGLLTVSSVKTAHAHPDGIGYFTDLFMVEIKGKSISLVPGLTIKVDQSVLVPASQYSSGFGYGNDSPP